MKFPGDRNRLHYFPRSEKLKHLTRKSIDLGVMTKDYYIVGLDQPILDVYFDLGENVQLLKDFNIPIGESIVLSNEEYTRLASKVDTVTDYTVFAGGAVSNILHNYSVLSGEKSYLLGSIPKSISFCDSTYHYLSKTIPLIHTNKLTPLDKAGASIATALTFLTVENGMNERTFALNMGTTNDYDPLEVEKLKPLVIDSIATVLTAYCLREPETSMYKATVKLLDICKENSVPVVLGLGTSSLVSDMREEMIQILRSYVTVAAMNIDEAKALTQKENVIAACNECLEYVDICVVTEGAKGITVGGYCDRQHLRKTEEKIHSKGIFKRYNEFEFSRLFLKSMCDDPVKVFSHVHPFLGGPTIINSTNGAGDSVVAAILHDIAANKYDNEKRPNSDKHEVEAFTFSSASRIAQYGNRIAYQILKNGVSRLAGDDVITDSWEK